MTRHYSTAQKAKRDKKFREQLAKKQSPVRFALALPADVKLEELDWNADAFERIAGWLADTKKRWAKEDDDRRRKRLAEVLEAVKKDGLL
ncbi:MAG TPA: hypothetical protein VN025_05940 [Candidatus Dormibacteraeota bacterium]|jgi:hypothetical protein|nr:hypothetical protein [Candidatus Dormibacteraeota bacterium]